MIDKPLREHRAQDAMHHIVQARFRDAAVGDRFAQSVAEIVFFVRVERGLLIETIVRGRRRRMHRSPIGQDEAFVSPIAFQHFIQQEIVFAGIDHVYAVIGAHHRAGIAAFDRDLEGKKITFAHGRLGNVCTHRHARGFLIVQCEVLDRRDDVGGLCSANGFAGHHPRKQRILPDIFERPPASRLARQVGPAAQHHIESFVARFGSDHHTARISQRSVPGRGR